MKKTKIIPAHIDELDLPSEIATAINHLWKDEAVQACFARSIEFQIDDSAQ